MTDVEALIASVLAAPQDDAPRLILADFLLDYSDERHECLRHEKAKEWTVRYVENDHRLWGAKGDCPDPRIPYLPFMDMKHQCALATGPDKGIAGAKIVGIMIEYAAIYGEYDDRT